MASFLQSTWGNVLKKSKAMDRHVDRYYQPVKVLAKGTSFMVGGVVTLATSFFEVGVVSINKLLSLPLTAGYKLLSLLTGKMVYEDISRIGNADAAENEDDNLVAADKRNLIDKLKYRAFAAKFFIKTDAEFTAYMELDGQPFITQHFTDRLALQGVTESTEEQLGALYIEELKQSIRENGTRNLKLYRQALYNLLFQPLPVGILNIAFSVVTRIGAALAGVILLALASIVVAAQSLLNYIVKGVDSLALLAHTAAKLLLNAPLYLLSGLRYAGSASSSLPQVLNSNPADDEAHPDHNPIDEQAFAADSNHDSNRPLAYTFDEVEGYGDRDDEDAEHRAPMQPISPSRLSIGSSAADSSEPEQQLVHPWRSAASAIAPQGICISDVSTTLFGASTASLRTPSSAMQSAPEVSPHIR